MEDTEGWILENNSNNENDFLSFEMNLMNFLSEEETPIASSSKNIIQNKKTPMNRIKDNPNKKEIQSFFKKLINIEELDNNEISNKGSVGGVGDKSGEGGVDGEGSVDGESSEGDEDEDLSSKF